MCRCSVRRRRVREGVEAWQAAGVQHAGDRAVVTSGGQLKALEEIFATFA